LFTEFAIGFIFGWLMTLLAFFIGTKMNYSEKPNSSKPIQFPKLRKTEPVIYEPKKDEEEEKANHFYQ
jgi:hypothetical protein